MNRVIPDYHTGEHGRITRMLESKYTRRRMLSETIGSICFDPIP